MASFKDWQRRSNGITATETKDLTPYTRWQKAVKSKKPYQAYSSVTEDEDRPTLEWIGRRNTDPLYAAAMEADARAIINSRRQQTSQPAMLRSLEDVAREAVEKEDARKNAIRANPSMNVYYNGLGAEQDNDPISSYGTSIQVDWAKPQSRTSLRNKIASISGTPSIRPTEKNETSGLKKSFQQASVEKYLPQEMQRRAEEQAAEEAAEKLRRDNYDVQAGQAAIDDAKKALASYQRAYDDAYELNLQNPNDETYRQMIAASDALEEKKQELSDMETRHRQDSYYVNVTKPATDRMNAWDQFRNSPEFASYAQQGAEIENPTWNQSKGTPNIFGWQPFAKEIQNPVTFWRSDEVKGRADNWADSEGSLYNYMTDSEVELYNALLARDREQGTDEAETYLSDISELLAARKGGKIASDVNSEDSKMNQLFYGAVSGMERYKSGNRQALSLLTSDKALTRPSSTYGSPLVQQDITEDGSLWKLAYDATENISNNALPAVAGTLAGTVLGPTVGGLIGQATFGPTVYGNAYRDEVRPMIGSGETGRDPKQAKVKAALSTASELGLGELIGGIPGVGGVLSGKAISALSSGINSAIARTGVRMLGNAMGEFTEESLQDIIEPVLDNIAYGEKNRIEITPESIYSGVVGAVTSMLMGGGAQVRNSLNMRGMGQNVIEIGKTEALVQNALNLPNTDAATIAERMQTGKMQETPANVGELLRAYAENGGNMEFLAVPAQETAQETAEEAPQLMKDTSFLNRWTGTQEARTEAAQAEDTVQAEETVQADDAEALLRKAAWEAVTAEEDAEILAEAESMDNSPAASGVNEQLAEEATQKARAEETTQPVAERQAGEAAPKKTQEATNNETGETVAVSGVESVEGGKVYLRTADGGRIAADEVGFENSNWDDVYSHAVDFDTNAARTYIGSYDGETSPADYYNGFVSIYGAARTGKTLEQAVSGSLYAHELSPAQQQAAYFAGQNSLNTMHESAQAGVQAAAQVEGKTVPVKAQTAHEAAQGAKTGVVRSYTAKLSTEQENSLKVLDAMGRTLNRKINIVDSIDTEGGKANAYFDPKTNEYTIALDSVGEAYLLVAAHENVHDIAANNREGYAKMESIVMDTLESLGLDEETLMDVQRALAPNENEAYWREEIVANTVPSILSDEATLKEFVQKMAGADADTRSAFVKFLDTMRDFLRNAFDKLKVELSWQQMQIISENQQAIERIRGAYFEALDGLKKKSDVKSERELEEISDTNLKYSIRDEAPPEKTIKGYKVFVVFESKPGQLFPPMVANPGGESTPVGVWLNADAAPRAADSKTGRMQVQAGGKGTQASKQQLAYRPGWHLGDLPKATQFLRTNPETGKKELFPANFVWAECECAADYDYQEEAMSYGYNKNGKFQHSLAGLPRLPREADGTAGYYRYRTNPNPDTVPWIITGAIKVNRILDDTETDAILLENGVDPVARQGGPIDLAKFGLSAGDVTTEEKKESILHFSMQDNVEETDKLLAIHNLTGSQLNGVLELGGFPMPSIAVLKATQGHDRYGDVSVVFDKATIDPKANSRNKVYGGDAWTPNFPAVEYEVNSEAAGAIQRKYYELANRKGYDFVRPMYTIANTLEDELNRRGGVGAIISDLEDDARMMNVFLEDSGAEPVEDIISRYTTRIPDETVQKFDTIASAVGKDAFSELYAQNGESPASARKRWLSEYKDRLVQGYTEFLKKFDFTDEQIQNVLNAETSRSLLDIAIKIRNYLKNGAETVTESVDTSATERAIREKTDTAKYKEWLHGLLDDAEGGKGIYNGKERYTASGNERSFNSTHWEMTLENIVRAMRADTKKGGGAFGDSGLFGLATKDYSSLDEIRADVNRLRLENDSEYAAQKTAFSNEYQAIAQEIMDKSESNPFIAQDNAMEAIADAVRRGKTETGIARVLKEYKQLSIRPDTARRVYELVQGIANMPTEYFEAKPERAVGLDEIKAVVMPGGKYAEIRRELENRGVPVIDYDPDVEGDRVRALNEKPVQGLRFSRQDGGRVLDSGDVKRLTRTIEQRDETIAALKQQLRLTHGVEIQEKEYGKLAGEILKATSSKYDKAQLTNELRTLLRYSTTQENPSAEEIETYGMNLASAVLEKAEAVNDTLYKETKDLRDYLRNTPIRLTSAQLQEAASAYDSVSAFRRMLRGRVKMDQKNGTSLDTVWQELSERFPALFDVETNEGDMATALADTVDMIYDRTPVNPYGFDRQHAAYDLLMDIYAKYMELPAFESFADKKAAALKKVREDYKKKIAEMRKTSKDNYEKRLFGEQNATNERKAELRDQYFRAKEAGDRKAMQRAAKEYRDITGLLGSALMRQRAAQALQLKRSRERQHESAAVKKYRGRIESTSKELMSWLTHPTDAKHVPDGMRKAVSGFLETIDFAGNKTTKKAEAWREQMYKLRDAMEKASRGAGDFSEFYVDIDPDFAPALQDYMERNSGVQTISEMNSTQLKELSEVLGMVKHAVKTSNQLHSNARYQQVSSLAEASRDEMSERRSKMPKGKLAESADQLLNFLQLDSFSYFKELGSASESVLAELRKGFDKKVERLSEAEAFMQKATEKMNLPELSGKKAQLHTFKTQEGKALQLTTAQIMELYLLNKREQARGHIYGMGIRVNETTAKEGKKTVRTRMHSAAKMTEADVNSIIGTLTAEQKRLADAMGKFLGDNVSAWGNETSMSMYGYKKFTEENYYPIRTDDNYTATREKDESSGSLYALKNLGMTKATQEGAKNPLILGDIFDTFTRHIDEMSSYNGLVEPLSDAMKWFNWKSEDGSVKQEIFRIMGERGKKWFKNFIGDINGQGMGANYSSDLMARLTGSAKAAAVGANARVVIQQPTSYVRAAAVMNPKYLLKALTMKSNQEMAQKYSQIAKWKSWGFYDLHTGRSMRDIIVGDTTLADNIRKKSMALAGKADDWTLGTLWNASALEMRELHPELTPGSEAFNNAVGARLSEIIDSTQVVDSVFHRSEFMRSKNGLSQMYTAFMAEPTKNYNLLRNAMMQAIRGKTKADYLHAARVATAFVVSSIGTAAAASIIDAFRDNDDEKNWLEKYMDSLGGNIVDNVNPLGMIPIVSDLLEIMQGYDPSRMDMQGAQKLWNVGTQWYKFLSGTTKWSTERLIYQSAVALSSVTGMPVSNLMRDLTGLYNTFTPGGKLNISGTQPTQTQSYASLYEAIQNGKDSKSKKLYDSLYAKALKDIKESDEKRVAAGKNPVYADESSYQTAARNAVESDLATILAKSDERVAQAYEYREVGNTGAYEKLYREMQAQGFSFNTIAKAINKYKNMVDKGETDTLDYKQESRYSADNLVTAAENALRTGNTDDVRKIFEERISASEAQDPVSSVRAPVTKELMPRYVEAVRTGNTEEAEKIASLLTDVFGYDEKTLGTNVTKDRNEDLRSAVETRDATAAKEFIAEARKAGKKDTDIAAAINDFAKEQITTAALNNDYKTYDAWLKFLRGLGLRDSKGNYYASDRISDWVRAAKEEARKKK